MKLSTPYYLTVMYVSILSLVSPFAVYARDLPIGEGKALNLGLHDIGIIALLLLINEFVIGPLIGILYVSAFILFFYGLFSFIKSENAEKKKQAKSQLMWSVIGIFAITSVWGTLRLMRLFFTIESASGIYATEQITICGGDTGVSCD